MDKTTKRTKKTRYVVTGTRDARFEQPCHVCGQPAVAQMAGELSGEIAYHCAEHRRHVG